MKTTHTKVRGSRFCTADVEVSNGRLSICGSTGTIIRRTAAKKRALEYWRAFFEENPSERREMGKRFGRTFRTDLSAARYVIASDGELHGLDVSHENDGLVYLTEGCGQIVGELAEFFPRLAAIHARWHLNDMHAECIHQEARGETWTTHADAVCPDCGYKLGSAWLKRDLPSDIEAQIVSAIEADMEGDA